MGEIPAFIDRVKEIEADRLLRAEKEGKLVIRNDPNEIVFSMEFDCPIQIIITALYTSSHKITRKNIELSGNYNETVMQDATHPNVFVKYKDAFGFHIKAAPDQQEKILKSYRDMPLTSIKKHKCIHNMVTSLPIPFFPNKCTITQEDNYYYISPNYLIVHQKNSTSGVPFGDYFHSYIQLHFKQNIEFDQQGKIKYKVQETAYFYSEFVKSTIFEGTIRGETRRETKELFNDKLGPTMKKLFN